MPRKHEIFVSHSSEDKVIADELCGELESRGFACWIAPRDIEPGVEYSQSLSAAISNSSIFLLILSTNADQSRHVRRELEIADRKGIPILPVRIEERRIFDNLDYFVSTQQWCDLLARPLGPNLGVLDKALRQRLGDPNSERLWRELGGHLADRYALPRPRALLSLDGGGIRGLITLELLARIEKLLAARSPNPSTFRLADFFDFIAGSGTGGLFAIALAQGRSAHELLEFFLGYASDIFGEGGQPFGSVFLPTANPLSSRLTSGLQEFIGPKATLSSESLRCLMMVLVRNYEHNTVWPLTNNPLAKYNAQTRPDSNLQLPLLPLARACLAWSPRAQPEVLKYPKASWTVRIGDGTFTPYSNPAFLLYQTATAPPYNLKWKCGERNLLLVSVGAGDPSFTSRASGGAGMLDDLLVPFMRITTVDQDIKCRTVGRCIHGPLIDREIGDLIPREADGYAVAPSKDTGREFAYVRYQPHLDADGLRSMGVSDPHIYDPERTFNVRSKSDLERLRDLGRLASEAVAVEHFGSAAYQL